MPYILWAIPFPYPCGRSFQGVLLIKRGDANSGLTLLRGGIEEQREAKFVQYLTAFLAPLAGGFAAAGQVAQGLATIDEALTRCEQNEERWILAELLRIKGELVLAEGAPTANVAAGDCFQHSLDSARRHGELSWELRAATSLARLWQAQGRARDAREALTPVYRRFTEGFRTPDLVTANALLQSLGGSVT